MSYETQQSPQDKKISVELTFNEALALTGVRFPQNHQLEVDAMHKIKKQLEEQLIDRRKNLQ
ncbi:hypothetical protein SAMN02799630_00098 [Paenibacillus sp. UNCCL117]|uniref:hypothetical protein n=1 Tax=unclassified Paenibacillus TaxID=185978 RepID=UPI00088EEB5C|nr:MULTISPECIES: hypothetical protein [unclassified Paenibacillus]SDC52845.1 hypothetical protein SAMN04488602_102434 [Paenibacillus sp. cl123]SFW11249.1 hypothetical protein SAMN02799630_00098 [Paenibacillus sp. UNCCL117]